MQVLLFWYSKSIELIVLYPAMGLVMCNRLILFSIQKEFRQFDQPHSSWDHQKIKGFLMISGKNRNKSIRLNLYNIRNKSWTAQ